MQLTLDDQIRAEDTHSGDTNTRLGGTVGGTQASEDDGTGATHGAKEGLCKGLAFYQVYEEVMLMFSMSLREVLGDVVGYSRTGYMVTDRVDGAR